MNLIKNYLCKKIPFVNRSLKILRLFIFLILVGLPFFALIKPYFHSGVPYTHDGENHLARFANYKVALKEGQFPPRFAPNLNNHYGYPVFNYNYPLANILSVPMSAVGISYEITFKLLMITALVIGAFGVSAWLKALNFKNRSIRFLSIASLLLAPFTVNLVYVRGSIGEIWALALFPWLLWLSHEIKEKKKVSWLASITILTSFLLAHNVSVLFGGIVWGIYTLIIFQKEKSAWKLLLQRGSISLGMSLWFWLPAMMEKNQIILDNSGLSNQFSNHFVGLLQLITAPLKFGYSYTSPVDTISMAVGLSGFIALILGTVILLKRKVVVLKSKQAWVLLILSWIMFIFQTQITGNIWRIIPLVQFIQFPWRLSLYFTILILPVLAMVMNYHSSFKKILTAVLIMQLIAVMRFSPADYFHRNTIDYDLFTQSTSTANENLPKTFTYKNIADWAPEPSVLQGQASISVTSWTGSKRAYSVDASEQTLLVEPTMYFLGWETLANHSEVIYADMKETDGRIGYWLEPGEYEIVSQFTQKTWPRLVGNSISVISAAIASWFIVHEIAKFKIKK
ncbi:MAG: hypothetical protein HOA85_02095 [Candidatus Pacebacteria bacterium]|jgi:hypothetical protein|nr:hypothetical protein [Candidatus Paceibacterota bacterium]MBT6756043.1 hypothetical protein [Candidatus Paceibacterota bacterium]